MTIAMVRLASHAVNLQAKYASFWKQVSFGPRNLGDLFFTIRWQVARTAKVQYWYGRTLNGSLEPLSGLEDLSERYAHQMRFYRLR